MFDTIEQNCIITIDSIHVIDKQRDRMTMTMPAEWTEQNGVHTVKYKAYYDGEESQESWETITIHDGIIEVDRKGFLMSHFTYEKGCKHYCSYISPAGEATLEINTESIILNIDEKRISARIKYTLAFSDTASTIIYFKFNVEKQ